MMGEHRLASFNDFAAIGLEGIGGIVQRNAEQYPNEEIGHTIDPQLEPRIIDDSAPFHEARAEYGIPALIEDMPIADDIAAIIGLVGHHDDDGVSAHLLQAMADGAAKSMRRPIRD